MVTDSSKYLWVLPIIGGVLVLISFFTPAASVNALGIEEHYWMWGLYYQSYNNPIFGSGSSIKFLPTEQPLQFMLPLFFVGVFPAILIFSGSIKVITSGNAVRTGRKSNKNRENEWIGIGIMMIIAPIIYIIGIEIIMRNYLEYMFPETLALFPEIPGFWDVYNPGFALIASFIGAILSIVGGIASKMIKPREEPIRVGDLKKFITKTPVESIVGHFNYCPECGQGLLYKEGKFCANCGFDFRI